MKTVGPPVTVTLPALGVRVPLVPQTRLNQSPVTVTGSLKVITTLLFTGTLVALFGGVTAVTVGGTSLEMALPRKVTLSKRSVPPVP